MARRRGNGEGSVKRLKSGSWSGQIMDGYTDTGKRRIISVTAPTKGEVLEKIRAHLNRKDDHIQLNKALTVGEWADTWYRDYQSQVQPSTYSGYQYTVKLIKGYLAAHKLCDVIPIHINGFLDKLVSDGYSLSQIRKCRCMLIQIFNSAEDNGLVTRNPARRSKMINGKDNRVVMKVREKDAFSDTEVDTLLKELPDTLTGYSIRTMLGTGLRVQELLALTPEDIAEDGSSIKVDKAIKMVGGVPTLGVPKSQKSNRTIPVPDEYRQFAVYLRTHGGKKFVWSLPGQNPYYGVGSFRRRFYSALKEVDGMRKLTPHCCRHTYITRLQARGVPLETISKLAGHSDMETTAVYLHQSEDTLKQAVTVLNGTTGGQ